MNPEVLKNIDRFLGAAFVSLWPGLSSPATSPPVPVSLLLIRPGGIGDAVLLTPAIAQLRKSFPSIIIDILAEGRNAGVFPLVPGVRAVYRYDHPREFLAVLRCRYDVVVDTEQWHRLSALVARVVRAPVKIGFATNDRRRMFNYPIPYSQEDYEADSFYHLLSPLGVAVAGEVGGPFLAIPQNTACRGAELVAPLEGRPFVTLFPGASIAERRWGSDRFREVVRQIEGQGFPVVVVGGKGDAAVGEEITRGLDGLNLAGQTTLSETAAILRLSRLLISGDSGVLHLAVGLGTPTVSLFGPGIASKWAPRGPGHRVINHELPCSPCTRFGTTPPCHHGVSCLAGIAPSEVVEAAMELLLGGEKPLDF